MAKEALKIERNSQIQRSEVKNRNKGFESRVPPNAKDC